jgi:protein-L-isoaspartate(D-aspartate) O-methyltransferase
MTTSAPKRFPLGLDDLVRVPAAKSGRTGAAAQGSEKKVNVGAKTATKATVAHAGFNPKPANAPRATAPARPASQATEQAKPLARPAALATEQAKPLARAAALATEQAKPHEGKAAPAPMPGFAIRSPSAAPLRSALRSPAPTKPVRPVAAPVKRVITLATRGAPEPALPKGLSPKPALAKAAANPGGNGSLSGSTQFTLTSERVRERMVERVRANGVSDPRVLAAMAAVPRHLFVDPGFATQAYEEAALPIGHHQTISKPSVVARMIELASAGRVLDTVLEIGTGCGYQAAVLSGVAREVYSIERIRPLHERAKQNLRPLRIRNIRLHYGDGRLGIPSVAPFDAIVIAAAGLDVPQALLEQLQIGGRLIAPVGGESQVLTLVERVAANEWHESQLDRVFFVPLKSGVI